MLKNFIDPKIQRVFERQIARFIKQPNLWNPELILPDRLYLIYGQSGMKECVFDLIKEHQIPCWIFDVTKDTKDVQRQIDLIKAEKHIPIVIILNAELLAVHHSLFLDTHYLKKQFQNVNFFIGISKDIPNQQYPFWDQFRIRIPMSTPTDKSYYKNALKFYFGEWAKHWTYSKVLLSEEDYDKLANACDFCTLKHVKQFVKRCFTFVLDAYPEKMIDINLELLENPNNFLMYASLGIPGVMCVCPEDAFELQRKFDPSVSRETREATFKRRKIEESMMEIE
jgi:hypothetical protein